MSGTLSLKDGGLKTARDHQTHTSPVAYTIVKVPKLGFCEKCVADQVSIHEIIMSIEDQIRSFSFQEKKL